MLEKWGYTYDMPETAGFPKVGSLATSRRALYTVPRGKSVSIAWFSIHNQGPVTATCQVYLHKFHGATSSLGSARLKYNHTARFIEGEERLQLSEGDVIEGIGSTNDLTFVISGTVN